MKQTGVQNSGLDFSFGENCEKQVFESDLFTFSGGDSGNYLNLTIVIYP